MQRSVGGFGAPIFIKDRFTIALWNLPTLTLPVVAGSRFYVDGFTIGLWIAEVCIVILLMENLCNWELGEHNQQRNIPIA